MKKILFLSALFFISIVVFHSCKKSDSLEPMRMFMPGTAISSTSAPTSVTLTWTGSVNTDTTVKNIDYLIEVATDSTFSNIVYTTTTKNYSTVITDDVLTPKKKYVARLQVKGVDERPDSKYLLSGSFSIAGENLFLPQLATDVQYYTAILRWTHQDGLTKVTITSGGVSVDSLISADTLLITGLSPNTFYTAELFKGDLSKGTTSFTTKDAGIFYKIIDNTSDLVTEINNLPAGKILGLLDGNYDISSAATTILKKNIGIASVSGNPSATTIKLKELTLKGDGAGISLKGIGFTGTSSYFINLIGESANGANAAFSNITVDNCIIKSISNAFIRASQGSTAGGQSIANITVNNCYGLLGTNSTYACFAMDNMKFGNLTITNSTFANFYRSIVSYNKAMTTTAPTILIDKCTFNNFGSAGSKPIVLDGSTNSVIFTLSNSILANTPNESTTLNTKAINATGTGSIISSTSNFIYNCKTQTATTPDIEWPSGSTTSVTLPWTSATTDFTLPVAVLNNGDPRWYH